jgi:phosphoglycerate dehydrogenase-like enzyme
MKVLIYASSRVKAWEIPDSHVAALRTAFQDTEFLHACSAAHAQELIRDADVAFAPIMSWEMVESAPRLTWIHSSAAAVEGLLPLTTVAERGITLTNSRGVQAVAIAEHVMGGLLVLSHQFNRTLEAQRDRRWIQNDLAHDWPWLLEGRNITVIGLGTIGLEVAKRASAFGMRITGVRRRTHESTPPFVERVVGPKDIAAALRGCDVLVIAAPGLPATTRMIGAEHIALLNPGALIVNVARAQIVDEWAMIHALESGRLGGAVLDVFEEEPLDSASRLWEFPNVVITPHSSGFRASHWDDVTALFAENLRRFMSGQPLLNVVDAMAGY